jgi:DNA-binding beta-propeller fold protein YncE
MKKHSNLVGRWYGAFCLVLVMTVAVPAAASAATPPSVTALHSSASSTSVTLSWKNPKAGTFTAIMVRRQQGTKAPSSASAGQLIALLSDKRDSVTDHSVKAGTHYAYAVFTRNVTSYSRGVAVKVTTKTVSAPSKINILTNGFARPSAITTDGTDVWVTNSGNNSVTEINESTRAIVQTLSSSNYDFDTPSAIASDGTNIWVANRGNNSVTELSQSTGALVQVLSDSSYGFDGPDAIADGVSKS